MFMCSFQTKRVLSMKTDADSAKLVFFLVKTLRKKKKLKLAKTLLREA